MAMSSLSNITNEFLALLETTAINKAIVMWNDDVHIQSYPVAQIGFYDGTTKTDINNTIDLNIYLNIVILGTSNESVCDILEEILVLFEDDSQFNTARTYGLIDAKLSMLRPPNQFKGQNQYIGSIDYECNIRFTY